MEQQIFILVGVSIISVITTFFTYKRNTPKDKASALVILVSVLWILGVGLEIASASYSFKVFWNKIQFICMIIVPTRMVYLCTSVCWSQRVDNKKKFDHFKHHTCGVCFTCLYKRIT